MKKRTIKTYLLKLITVILATVITLVSVPTIIMSEGLTTGLISSNDNVSIKNTTNDFKENRLLRDEFSKHYTLKNGENFAVIFPEPVHYYDENEGWKDVDNRLTYNATTQKYISANPKFTTAFADNAASDELVSITADGYTVSWSISFSNISDGKLISEKANADRVSVTNGKDTEAVLAEVKQDYANIQSNTAYTNAISTTALAETVYKEKVTDIGKAISEVNYFNAIDNVVSLKYSVLHGKIEEDIILRSPSGFVSYTLTVNTGGLVVYSQNDGEVVFENYNGETVFVIDSPWMSDAVCSFSKDISVSVVQDGDIATITYTPDDEWLKSNERVYPVLIDPTFTTRDYTSNYVDTYIMQGEKDYTLYEDSQTLQIGTSPVGYWCGYIKILNIPNISRITYQQITSANLQLWTTSRYNYSLNLNEVTSPWAGETNISTPSYSRIVSNISSVNQSDGTYKYTFDLTNFFHQIYRLWGDYSYYWENIGYGFMLDSATSTPDSQTWIQSSEATTYRPVMTITYNFDLYGYVFDGGVYSIGNANNPGTLAVNVHNGYDVTGTNIYMLQKDDSLLSQAFKITYNENSGYYKIKPICSSNGNGKALGFDFESTVSDNDGYTTANVELFDDIPANANNIEWVIEPSLQFNGFIIISRADPNLALTFKAGLGSGTGTLATSMGNVYVSELECAFDEVNYTYNYSVSQQWTFFSGGQQIVYADDISNATVSILESGNELYLNCYVSSFGDTITWSSSDTCIASVEKGVVTGRSIGDVTITATTKNNLGEVIAIQDLNLNVIPSSSKEYYLQSANNKSVQCLETHPTNIELSSHEYLDIQRWNFIYSSGYFKIQNVVTGYYLTAPSFNSENIVITSQEYNSSISNRQQWKLTRLSNGKFKIQSKYHENTSLVLYSSGVSSIVQRNYVNDSNFGDEWNIMEHPPTVHIQLYADEAYRNLDSNYSSRIDSHMQTIRGFFLDEFGMWVEYSSVQEITSLGDQCDDLSGSGWNPICTHATNTNCKNSVEYLNNGTTQTLHHKNVFNIAKNFYNSNNFSSNDKQLVFTGHNFCMVDENGEHKSGPLGMAWQQHGLVILGDILNRHNETMIILHEVLHLYGANDHYGPNNSLTGNANYDANCMFGDNRENITGFVLCNGCMADITANIDTYKN